MRSLTGRFLCQLVIAAVLPQLGCAPEDTDRRPPPAEADAGLVADQGMASEGAARIPGARDAGAPPLDSTSQLEPPPPPAQPPPAQPPSGCVVDTDCCPYALGCAAGEVQHCDKPAAAATGTCKPGCRSHAACKKVGLESCNGLYQCIKGGKHGDPCDEGYPKKDLDDCRFGYYCCPILKKCFEQCSRPGDICPDTGKKCIWWPTGPKCFG